MLHSLEREGQAESSPREPRRRARFSVRLPWVVLGLALSLLLLEIVRRHLSGDAYWDLAVGRWELHHWAVLRTNPFSWGDAKGWINTEWLWGPIVFLASLGGPWGLIGIAAVGALGFLAGIGVLLRLRKATGPVWAIGMLFSAAVSSMFWDFRPQVWAYGLAVWGVVYLDWVGRGETFTRWKWRASLGAAAGLLLWVQIHGSWVLFPAWAILYALFGQPSRRRWYLGSAGLSLALGVFVNPWPVMYVGKALFTVNSSAIANGIGEWLPPDTHSMVILSLYVLYLLAGIRVLRSRHGLQRVMWFGFLIAAIYAVRFMPYLAIGMAYALSDWDAGWRKLAPAVKAVFMTLALVIMGFAGSTGMRTTRGNLIAGPFVSRMWEPVAAVNWMVKHHDTTRVLNGYRAGGYLIYRGIPDWIDGRADFWLRTSNRFQRYSRAREGMASPMPLVDAVRPRVIVAESWSPLVWGVAGRQGWHYGFRGHYWSVLVK